MNQLNTPTAHQIDEYVNLLKAHDWFYDYSDDHAVWNSGREQANKISAKAMSHEIYNQIYRAWRDTIQNRKMYPDPAGFRNRFVEAIKAELPATVEL